MRKTLGLVSALALVAGLAAGATGPHGIAGQKFSPVGKANAAQVFKEQAINGTTGNYAVIAPTFYTTTTSGPNSYIRFFNGAGAAGSSTTSTFRITVVGDKTGNVYGAPFNIAIPHMASPQYSMNQLVTLAGATLGNLSGGDTGYVLYVSNADSEAGYMHAVYDFTSKLFENMSMCNTEINAQMTSLHNEVVLTNVHTSNVGSGTYPSTIRIHNYYNVPITYTITVFDAGADLTPSLTPTATAGTQICKLTGNTVAANTTLTIPVTNIEANAACSAISTATHINVVIADQSGGAPNAVPTDTIFVADYSGSTGMSMTCAVNPVSTTSAGGGGGVIISPYL
jgi:hypothetical protein